MVCLGLEKERREITGALNDGNEWRCNNNGKMIESVSGLESGLRDWNKMANLSA